MSTPPPSADEPIAAGGAPADGTGPADHVPAPPPPATPPHAAPAQPPYPAAGHEPSAPAQAPYPAPGQEPYAAPTPPPSYPPGPAAPYAQAAYPPPPPGPAAPYGAPSYGAPAYGYGYVKTNVLAVISLISSLVGVLFSWTFVLGLGIVAGVVTGHIALRQIARSGEKGRGMALAGVIIGWVGIGLTLLGIIGVVLFWGALGVGAATYGA